LAHGATFNQGQVVYGTKIHEFIKGGLSDDGEKFFGGGRLLKSSLCQVMARKYARDETVRDGN
jgi:hypothetical protein